MDGTSSGSPPREDHSHLPPADVAADRKFANLYEIWLEGDHYKWRAMRANGIDERFCLGDASPYEKYLAWARTIPWALRNPLYHWTHMELKRGFGINDLLSEETAPAIWERANVALQSDDMSTHGLLRKFRVLAVCTTDDRDVRLRAAHAVLVIDVSDTEGIDVLAGALGSRSSFDQGQAADRLGSLGARAVSAVPALRAYVAAGCDGTGCVHATRALEEIQSHTDEK